MRWFQNQKTAIKLMLGFGLVCLIMAGVGYVGVVNMEKLHTMLDTLYERDLVGLSEMKEAQIYFLTVGRAVRQAIIETDQGKKERMARDVETTFVNFSDHLAKAERTIITERGKALIAEIKQLLPAYQTAAKEALQLAVANDPETAKQMLPKLTEIGDQVRAAMMELVGTKEKLAQEAIKESDVIYGQSRTHMFALIFGALVFAGVLGYVIARLVARPLGQAVAVLKAVADGDFTQHLTLDTKDEVGQMAAALNQSVDAMRAALQEVSVGANQAALASQQLSAASEELSSGSQEQASSLEETAASLEEITGTVKQNADNARQASQLAVGSRDAAEKGGQVVMTAVAAMGEINKSSKKIADIITVIDEIAFQTNLLALNAAVEAARAGEQGRGFAVVAAEVRNLAQRSATAAKEIKGLIQDSVQKVENGSELVNKSGQTLQEIVGSVKRVTDIVAEIAAASQEQSSGIEQVNKAMMQMDQVTQANAAQTEELSSTAQAMAAQAEQLQALVSRFKLGQETSAAKDPMTAMAASKAVAEAKKKTPTFKPTASKADSVPVSVLAANKATHEMEGEFEEF